ncbi:MAG: fibronectin type III domain-containing protein, partial [Proteobacteria bacterium]|nr:fibronectin type III domain-containing protein [Pseudomonadota bacterium]
MGCVDAQEGDEDELESVEQDITAAPMNLTATITSPSQVTLNWTGPVGATYVIQRSNTPGTETNYTSNSPATSTTFVDAHLLANTQYCYVIRANVVGAGGLSSQSNEQCVTMSSGPQAPAGVSALATSSTSITVTWNAVPNATLYYIYMAKGAGTYSSIGTATPPTTSFVVN